MPKGPAECPDPASKRVSIISSRVLTAVSSSSLSLSSNKSGIILFYITDYPELLTIPYSCDIKQFYMLRHAEKHCDSLGLKGLAKAIAGIRQDYKERIGEDDIPLTVSDQKVSQEASLKTDLRQQTYELLALVREPTEEEKKTLKKRGIVFLFTEIKSLFQVVSQDSNYFWSGEQEYVDSKTELRDYVPPVPLQVGLNFENPAIPGSFNKSKSVQLEMIEEQSQELQKEFPDARLVMLPSTIYAQADKAYKEKTGEVFFKNIFARALDQTSGVSSMSMSGVPGLAMAALVRFPR